MTFEQLTFVNTERYPIHRLDNEQGQTVIKSVRHMLAEDGCAILKDFIRPESQQQLIQESRELSPRAFFNQTVTNPYSSEDNPDLPADHPQRLFMERSNGFVAQDLIPRHTIIRNLYHSANMQTFVAACIGSEKIYEYEDPLAGAVVNVLRPGCQHPWHFDNNEFIVSLMTQKADSGGLFEYCPRIRSRQDENYDTVSRVIRDEERTPVKTLDITPGDLQIFYGRHSLHRVTRVAGNNERHTLILAYADEPGVITDPVRAQKLFGRYTQAHVDAADKGKSRTADSQVVA